ncbi:MAG TPA: terminase small subunit [Stellaceae bacterium]|nr:terminase small subunit [Stellaceae bacterium]
MMTARQQRFVEEYLAHPNAHQAALRAGYKPKWARQTVTGAAADGAGLSAA